MSSTPSQSNLKPQKVVVPKVWKRPHSTIYGKNVEFGNRLYSDKIGELNGRKFNSDLPWHVRNSGASSGASIGSSSLTQGYLSKLLNEPESTLIGSVITQAQVPTSYRDDEMLRHSTRAQNNSFTKGLTRASCSDYADVLELTNPNRYSKRRQKQLHEASRNSRARNNSGNSNSNNNNNNGDRLNRRIDLFDNYLEFCDEINRVNERSRLASDPLLKQRRMFDNCLVFNNELGMFVPSFESCSINSRNANNYLHDLENDIDNNGRSLVWKRTLHRNNNNNSSQEMMMNINHKANNAFCYDATTMMYNHSPFNNNCEQPNNQQMYANTCQFNPVVTTTQQTHLLPKHACQLASSPYGQSADGRKLSLGSINPHSYRPSLPHKTSTVHASDGEEFEFQDKSSPFYTDRWAGKTIRHFDSDLYSNANLFKSMIL